MNSIYWNLRGFANTHTRLAFKKLCKFHKPDFFFIAEPWMNLDALPPRFFLNLNYKIFSFNNRDDNLPNLWGLCSVHLNHTVIISSDQHISYIWNEGNDSYGATKVYASTFYIARRRLWQFITQEQRGHNIPWYFMGDFNTILGAHEYRGHHIPARIPMDDFRNWSDQNYLIHMPTVGVQFTWSNRRTDKRLDHTICNKDWLDNWNITTCSTLTKTSSDHFPIMLEWSNQVHSFPTSFRFMKMWSMHDDCINIIKETWNNTLIGCHMTVLTRKLQILKDKLKMCNKVTFGNVHQNLKEASLALN
jgi:hypothetical protein